MTVEIKNMIAKLKTLEAMQSCPACGNSQWEPQARIVSLPAVVGDRVNPLEGLPCLALLCTHCGYLALHSTQLLETR
jgi:predicted nucleic-acid-binding Zn-ribbon protein